MDSRPLRKLSNLELIEIINNPNRYTDEIVRDAHYELAFRRENPRNSKVVNKAGDSKSILLFQTEIVATPAIIWLNVLVFLFVGFLGVDIFNPNTHQLFAVGGMQKHHFLNGDWWRVFSSMFLHSGVMHIGFNMFALLQIGTLSERLIGPTRYTIIYLICGVFGALAMITFGGDAVGVGASGAIFGIFGLTYFLLKSPKIKGDRRQIQSLSKQLGFFIVLNIVIGLSSQGISNAAHMGGLVTGAILCYIYLFNYPQKLGKIAGNLIAISLSTLIYFGWTNNLEKEKSVVSESVQMNEEDCLYSFTLEGYYQTEIVDKQITSKESKKYVRYLNSVIKHLKSIEKYDYDFSWYENYLKSTIGIPVVENTESI